MSFEELAQEFIEKSLNESITAMERVGGGFIAEAYRAQGDGGKSYFIKGLQKVAKAQERNFEREAYALGLLGEHFRVPEVLVTSEQFLVLEWIDSGSKSSSGYQLFGKSLARMHRKTISPTGRPGFPFDNTIGATLQLNENSDKDWPDFFWDLRIKVQLEWAQSKGLVLEDNTIEDFKKSALKLLRTHCEEGMSLLHGDLWGGNHQFDSEGNPWLFDPASYYGHREADLAMMRLFGGFPSEVFDSYEREFPLESGWRERLPLYQLYHVLNHVNLFGGSYLSQAKALIKEVRGIR